MSEHLWWQEAVFYQIYPRSFADSNGDGIGDIPGIISRLDYLQDLGVDAVWLSPHYPSPLFDCGYDVSDYTAVAPEYGTMADFDALLDGLHRRGMHLILDMVLNHTSDQHPWFQESRSSRNSPWRDWYIWRDGKGTDPPNNWYSTFGGPAWELDPQTQQYYYHFFFKQQPDLDWRNPEVRQAMIDSMRFWLDKGVDGFRLDAIGTLFEDRALTNQAAGATQLEWYWKSRSASTPQERQAVDRIWKKMFRYQHDLPEIHGLMRELRALSDDYPGTMLVGETDMLSYYGTGQDELHMVFNFPLMQPDVLTAGSVALNQKQRLSAIPHGAWPGNTLGNHDTSRVASHFGDGLHNAAFSRLSLALMLTLKGTPFLYNGEEIGMTDLLLDNLDDFRDELGKWVYGIEVDEFGTSPAAALAYAARAGRDKTRTPMQWADAPHAGFCPPQVQPWLPINPNYREGLNVQEQDGDPDSLLTFYRQLLRIRRQLPALRHGEYTPVSFTDEGYLAFLRTSPEDHQSLLVLLNWSDQAFKISLDLGFQKARVKFSSLAAENLMEDLSSLEISPFEITIAELQP